MLSQVEELLPEREGHFLLESGQQGKPLTTREAR